MSTLASLIKDMRLQLRRYGGAAQINPDEARWYVNLAYTYYLMRLGSHKETDLISRLPAIDITAFTPTYAIPDSVVLITGVIIAYEGREFYLFRQEPKGGSVGIGANWFGSGWFESGWFAPADVPIISTAGWMPTVQLQGRLLRLIPEAPVDIPGGLIIEGTTFPTFLVEATDVVSTVLPLVYHPLITVKAAILAMADAKQPTDAAETALGDMENMFDVLSSNRSMLREIVDDSAY